MRLKFWKKKVVDLDYGRIADVDASWFLAYDEEAQRIEAKRAARAELDLLYSGQFAAVMYDDPCGMFVPEVEDRIEELRKIAGIKKPIRPNRPDYWIAPVVISRDVTHSRGNQMSDQLCLAISQTDKSGEVVPCILDHRHRGPHQRNNGDWIEPIKPPAIIVFDDIVIDPSGSHSADVTTVEEALEKIEDQHQRDLDHLMKTQRERVERFHRGVGRIK